MLQTSHEECCHISRLQAEPPESLFAPAPDNTRLEFIELHNQLAVNMESSQWQLAGRLVYQFPDGKIVAGRGVIADDPQAFEPVPSVRGSDR